MQPQESKRRIYANYGQAFRKFFRGCERGGPVVPGTFLIFKSATFNLSAGRIANYHCI